MFFKKLLKKFLRIFLPLGLGIILLWYLYRNQDIGSMMEVVRRGVDYRLILFSLGFGLFGNVMRAFRWSLLIDSLGKRVGRTNAVNAVLGNYAINMALPRVGEIWRCGVIAKQEKIPFTKLLGTLFVDRLLDWVVVSTLTLCLCVFNIGFFRKFFSENPPLLIEKAYQTATSVWTYIILALLVVAVWYVFVKLKHFSFVQKIKGIMRNIWEGFKSLWVIRNKALFTAETLLIWLGYFFYFYVTFFAFDFTRDLGLRIGLITFAMSSISVAVPVQGGIGVWHFMIITTLTAFGVSKTDAGAFALVVFTVQTVWLVLTGLYGIIALASTKNKNYG
ncbi:MAG: flippase-like domain-containing protein [Tannerella sp.]|jgi:uncharacterized membrane protein YbhN (UPF0104 family)|nr:flippase-like domain-containing protein [Tannerella sp.]